jgi:hypothetical protein
MELKKVTKCSRLVYAENGRRYRVGVGEVGLT